MDISSDLHSGKMSPVGIIEDTREAGYLNQVLSDKKISRNESRGQG